MNVLLPDGSTLVLDQAAPTLRDVAEKISPRLAKEAVAGKVDGTIVDLSSLVSEGVAVEILTLKQADGLWVLRHSTAHIMATAVKRLFPESNFGIGPPIQDGFYYDFELPRALTDEDLESIEAEMREVIAADVAFERDDLGREEALERLRASGERFKVELVEKDLADEAEVSFYRDGDFVDLCRGPHLPSTCYVKAFKLLNVSGAYWKGKETNPMLQRIYGTAWRTDKDLKAYLHWREEAKKRDHRKLGKELGLFSFKPESPGMPFWQPHGTVVFNEMVRFYREHHAARGYHEVRTPLIMDEDLWRRSGHWDNYQENMFFTASEDRSFAVKPMNCPGHCLLFAEGVKSYRELPLRLTEPGHCHRNEKSGTLHGLFRVRTFIQDDAHIYCTPEQIEDEIVEVISFVEDTYKAFGFDDYRVELSTRPEKSIGSDAMWEGAEAALAKAVERSSMAYQLNPGDGAFYGPKIDFHVTDCVGRSWQCGTVQLDFSMPERFELEYVGADNERHTPVMIHRAIFGSLERMIGILVEHFAGALPVWLSPVQVAVLPIADAHHEGAESVAAALTKAGVRVQVDRRNLKIGKKVREAAVAKIPYQIMIGDREVEDGSVSVRARGNRQLGSMAVEAFVERIGAEIAERRVEAVESWRRPVEELPTAATY